MRRLFLALLFTALASQAWAAWLYSDVNGVARLPYSKGNSVGIGYSDQIFTTGPNDMDVWKWADGGWSEIWVSGQGTGPRGMWVDSRDYIYVSYTTGKLFRSIDSGANFTEVLADNTASVFVYSFAEDNSGNLYASFYPTYNLKYSSDNGATWDNVALPTDYETTYPDHLHTVYWCPHRNVLMISGGDTDGAPISYTSLKGAAITAGGWSTVADSTQATVITSDANYVYYSNDATAAQGNISRVTWPAGGSPSTISTVYDGNNGNWSFSAHVNQYGYIIFCLSNGATTAAQLVASVDGGQTFSEYASYAAAKGPAYPSSPTAYNTTWDGFYYSGISDTTTDTGWARWQILPDTYSLHIDNAASPFFGNGLSSSPMNPVDVYSANKAVAGRGKWVLDDDITTPIYLFDNNSELNGQSHGVGGYSTAAPTFTDTLEGASTLTKTETNATVSLDNTDNPHAGAKSIKYTATANATIQAKATKTNGVDLGVGATAWWSGWYYPSQTFVNEVKIGELSGSSFTVDIGYKTTLKLYAKTVGIEAASREVVQTSAALLSMAAWNYIKVSVYIHNTQGYIIVWCNNQLAFSISGIDTYDGVNYKSAWWGAGGATVVTGDTLFWDDVVLSSTDPDNGFTIRVIADNVTLSRLNQTNKVYLSSNGGVIKYSIFNGAAEAVKTDVAGAYLYNNTFYNNTVGINALDNATVKNNIFWNGDGTDITIAADKEIAGDYDLFQDAAAAGDGTYTDGGNTTFGGADPLFVSATDYHLQSGSPAINAGVDVGLTEDYRGMVVPQGSAPDIGAYEFGPGDPGFLKGTYRGTMGIHWMW
jgi:hypothetical protein